MTPPPLMSRQFGKPSSRLPIRLKFFKNAHGEYEVVPLKQAAACVASKRQKPTKLAVITRQRASRIIADREAPMLRSFNYQKRKMPIVAASVAKSESVSSVDSCKSACPTTAASSLVQVVIGEPVAVAVDWTDQCADDPSESLPSNDEPRELVPSLGAQELRRIAKAIVNSQSGGGDDDDDTMAVASGSTVPKKKPPAACKRAACNMANCGQDFASKANLRRHMVKSHMNLKPFVCRWPQCSYSAKIRYDVVRHVKRHISQAEQQEPSGAGSLLLDANKYVAEDTKVSARLEKELKAIE